VFVEYANRVAMDDGEFRYLRTVVDYLRSNVQKTNLKAPIYVCTIKKSHVQEGKAKMVNITGHTKRFIFIFYTVTVVYMFDFFYAVLFKEIHHEPHYP
jgi:hypothetical protein